MNIYKRILIKIDIYFLIKEQISIKYMESLENLANHQKKFNSELTYRKKYLKVEN